MVYVARGWGGEGEMENSGVISVNIERWKLYLLQTWLYIIPKMNAFLAFAEPPMFPMDLSPKDVIIFSEHSMY